jgi:hypothetical protein
LQPLVQLFRLFLNISKEVIVISWQWPLLGHPIAKFRGGEGVPKPGPRRPFVRGGGSSELKQVVDLVLSQGLALDHSKVLGCAY